MLTRKNDAPLDFDFTKAVEQSKDNPVFYVQYAHARTHSLFRKATAEGIAVDVDAADLSLLGAPGEIEIIRQLASWPRMVEIAAQHQEPHRITFYLYDLASSFNGYFSNAERFVQPENPGLTNARLAMAKAVRVVISAGLGILGVAPMKEM
jgi:arginyl-tRNA synthetase